MHKFNYLFMIFTSDYDCEIIQKTAIKKINEGEDKRAWLSNVLDVCLMGNLEYLQKAQIIDKIELNNSDFFNEVHTREEIKKFCKEITK